MWYNTHMMQRKFLLTAGAAALAACAAVADVSNPSSSARYATDAYPGFDREEEIVTTGKKEPRWFSWINGPAKDNAADQLAYARACAAEGSWRAARRGYDALVREWPTAPEAPVAQEALADLYYSHYLEFDRAFEEYRYLLDYYSMQCAYETVAARLYETAKMMRAEGKTFMFFRFANTVDVRRAFEALVLRAPGAPYAAEAMLAVAELREDDLEYDKAIQVYENIRNLYANTPEARTALVREAAARMELLRKHAYNRSRCQDTIAFLRLALAANLDAETRDTFTADLREAVELVEDEAYRAAKFYDSRTRTKRSAIAAYERFLKDYPASVHAPAALARLTELQQETNEQ